MARLRTIIAGNIRAYRKNLGLSQMQLADLVDTAPNYIAMIEAERRFPSDTMLEKIAAALRREPVELFSVSPIQNQWEINLLGEISSLISVKLQKAQENIADK